MLLVHRDPGVGDHAVGTAHGVLRRAGEGDLCAVLPRPFDETVVGVAALGRRDVQPEAEAGRALEQGVQHVVAVAGPGEQPVPDAAAMLLERHDVGHDLAGMGVVRQAVDHRYRGVFGQLDQPVVLQRADHDRVDVAREDLRGIGDRLRTSELHLRSGEHDGLAAELAHRHVERHAGARRRLVEDHRQHLAVEGAIAFTGLEAALALPGIIENGAQILSGNAGEVREMARKRGHASCLSVNRSWLPRTRRRRRRGYGRAPRGYPRRTRSARAAAE